MASQITANIIKNGEPVDILYGRLSQEDDHAGDSNSIVNQRSYLEKYAADNGFQNPVFMADDGYSGTNFDRPGWQDIVTLIEAGLVRTLIVKDMSRLGREYLKVGELTELYFPSKGVRFIAVNDGVDSLVESSSDFNPIRNWANELHAKDTSRKVRSVKRMQAENGERLGGKPPYGYRKRDDDSKRLVPDEETKGVVQRIFKLCAEGKGPNQIARILRDDHVLNPTNQYYQQTGVACTRLDTTRPYNWCGATVANILSNPVYVGHTLNMQSSTLSYKNKQIFHRPPEEQVLVENTHEAIIDRETWQAVQRELSRRNRATGCGGHGNRYPLSGKIRCGECGKSFSHRTKKRQDGSSYYRWCCFTATNEGLRRTDGAGNVIGCSVGRQIRDDIAMDLLRRSVNAVTLDKKSIISSLTRVVESVLASGEDSGEQELRRLEFELEKLQARNDTIHDRFFDESITKADYQRAKARCESEMNRVQEKIAAIKQRQTLNTDTQTLKPDIRAAITGIVSGRTADDDFYGHLLQQMTVYRDGRVEVALNLLPAKWVYVLDGLEKYRDKIGVHDASSVPISVSRPLSSG